MRKILRYKTAIISAAVFLCLMSSVLLLVLFHSNSGRTSVPESETTSFAQTEVASSTAFAEENTTEAAEETTTPESKAVTIACVGDSITYGSGVKDKNGQSYEAYLQAMLPDESKVYNFGVPGATLQNSGNLPYREQNAFSESLEADADIYILMLGTNDTKRINWNPENYRSELEDFIGNYTDIAGTENVFYMLPPHTFYSSDKVYTDKSIIEETLAEQNLIIKSVTDTLGVKTIDLFSLTNNHPEWYSDGLHPNAAGNKAIAEEIYRVLNIP